MVEGHRRVFLIMRCRVFLPVPLHHYVVPLPCREDFQRVNRHRARLQFHHFPRPRQIIGALAIDHQRGIGGRHLADRTSELRQDRLNRGQCGPHIACRHNFTLKVERISLNPELYGEGIDFARIEHAPGEFGRLAQCNGQYPASQRIECAAMADLDLGIAALAQIALHRADRLGRAETHGLVENDPAVKRARTHCPAMAAASDT